MKHIKLFESLTSKDINEIKTTLKEILYDISDNLDVDISIRDYKRNGKYIITFTIVKNNAYNDLRIWEDPESINLYSKKKVLNRIVKYMNQFNFKLNDILGISIMTRTSFAKNYEKLANFHLPPEFQKKVDLIELLKSIEFPEYTFTFHQNNELDSSFDQDKLNLSRKTWYGARKSISGWDDWVNKNKELFT